VKPIVFEVNVPKIEHGHQGFQTYHKENIREEDTSEKFVVLGDQEKYLQQWLNKQVPATAPVQQINSNLHGQQSVTNDDLKFDTTFYSFDQSEKYVQPEANAQKAATTFPKRESAGVYEMQFAQDGSLNPNSELHIVNQPEDHVQQWSKKHTSATLADVDDSYDLSKKQSLSDERIKRNPELYSFQPETPEENSWTINVDFVENNKAALGPSIVEHGTNLKMKPDDFKTYDFNQGRFSLLYTPL
jgi:hypothetical protein